MKKLSNINVDRLDVALIGVGGTGASVARGLARINNALIGTGMLPLNVTLYDDDIFEKHNVAKQHCSEHDVGINKAIAIAERLNMTYGTAFNAIPTKFVDFKNEKIVICCVDSVLSRRYINSRWNSIAEDWSYHSHSRVRPLMIDCGNEKDTGQILVSLSRGNSFTDVFKDAVDDVSEPTCSAYESLFRQDLFTNSRIAITALDVLWRALNEATVDEEIIYVSPFSITRELV